ncbi:hypothetical protein DM806_17560 [Sphingobium lactosutens]|uniref:TonB-dependent receptor n=1 Tax=Sphingobium lactosutens TaxID=522773 RepID=UPI0015BA8064|nr:TonB-dependent receptor [Sphingobium lactosutens]NWK97441.1 hypothetical protein [Sphingobium lactosutens]
MDFGRAPEGGKINPRYRRGCVSTIALALASMPSYGWAQEADAQDTGIGDIVVTAQRRAERTQDVPISISAVSEATLDRQHIKAPMDLQIAVPALTYNQLVGFAQPFLRGIGTDITQPNAAPSVATYVDGVYIADPQGVMSTQLAVERVEVLVGPQAALYGRNALGGAISYVTLTPGQEVKGKLELGYGNYDRKEASGYLSGPLTDRLSVGIYATFLDRDTYIDFEPKPRASSEPDSVRQWGARLKVVWEASDAIKLTASADITGSHSPEFNAYRQTQPTALGYILGAPGAIPPRYSINTDFPSFTRMRGHSATVKEEIDLGFADLVGISAYRYGRVLGSADYDATQAPLFAFGNAVNRARQSSQELQIQSKPGSAISWLAGGLYFHERSGQYDFRAVSLLFAPADQIQFIGRVRSNSYALFGQVTFPLADGLNLTAGGRYTHDEKSFDGAQNILSGPIAIPVPVPSLKRNWNNFSPKAVLDYKFGNTMLYASYSRGYKVAAYNLNVPTSPGPVNPETMDAFEIGNKSDFLGGTLRFNSSLFYYKVHDLQVQTVQPSSSGATVLQNAKSATVKGAEASLTLAPVHDLVLNASAVYLDTEYGSFGAGGYGAIVPGPAGNAIIYIDPRGNRLQRAPKFTVALGADYTHEFSDSSKVEASIKARHTGRYFWDPSNLFAQKSYWTVNGSISYTLPSTPLKATLWATNLTNQYYNTLLNPNSFGVNVFDAEPRMYGVSLSWSLK